MRYKKMDGTRQNRNHRSLKSPWIGLRTVHDLEKRILGGYHWGVEAHRGHRVVASAVEPYWRMPTYQRFTHECRRPPMAASTADYIRDHLPSYFIKSFNRKCEHLACKSSMEATTTVGVSKTRRIIRLFGKDGHHTCCGRKLVTSSHHNALGYSLMFW